LKRRIELNLTQQEVVALSKKHEKSITQAQLSKIEIGDENVTLQTYEKALYVLGLSGVKLEFSDKELIHG
jgi:transcriptional regulator with XRE-family HTH domain